jgi:hypothetical protein
MQLPGPGQFVDDQEALHRHLRLGAQLRPGLLPLFRGELLLLPQHGLDVLVDHGDGDLEGVGRQHLLQEPTPEGSLGLLVRLLLQVLPDPLPELLQGLELPHRGREGVVQLGKLQLLPSVQEDPEAIRLSPPLLGGEVIGEGDGELPVLSGRQRPDGLLHPGDGLGLAQHELVGPGLVPLFLQALDPDRDLVPVPGGAGLGGNPRPLLFPEPGEDLLHLLLPHRHPPALHLEAGDVGQLEAGGHVEGDLEGEVLVPLVVDLRDLSLGDGTELPLLQDPPVGLADDPVQELLVQGRAEPLLDDGRGDLPGPESGKAELGRQLADGDGALRLHDVGGDGDAQRAAPPFPFLQGDLESGGIHGHSASRGVRGSQEAARAGHGRNAPAGARWRPGSAKGGTRTPTARGHEILSLARLPVPPLSRLVRPET